MKEEKLKLRRKIYALVAEYAKKMDKLEEVYINVVNNLVKNGIDPDEAKMRVKAALGTFDERGKIPDKIDFPFISVIDMACSGGNNENCVCNEACETKAILTDKGKATVDFESCLVCGLCIAACPEGAITDKTEIAQTINMIKKGNRVYAILAPAFSGQFGENVSEEQVKSALLLLGFYDVIEVALGADMITVKEAREYIKRMDRGDKFMITSCCCPPFIRLTKTYKPKIAGLVSDSVSPMVATARFIKAEDKDAKVVFIGPCIAKKSEAKLPELKDAVDTVLTFEELDAIFTGYGIKLNDIKVNMPVDDASHDGRIYAHTGGVSEAIMKSIKNLRPDLDVIGTKGNGIKQCKEILDSIERKEVKYNFVEGMACIGGCVGGPGKLVNPQIGAKCVDKFANKSNVNEAVNNEKAVLIYEKNKDKVNLESSRM